MINCAHPNHFRHIFEDQRASSQDLQRIRALRVNASKLSHAELDECETLDEGDPEELAQIIGQLVRTPDVRINILGGCCGTDARHVRQMARQVCTKKS